MLRFFVFVLVIVSCTTCGDCADGKTDNVPKSNKTLQLTGKVDILGSYLAGSGITLESMELPSLVLKVRLGTPAFHAGVLEGDRVLNGSLTGNNLSITIRRNDKTYLVKLRARPDSASNPDLKGKNDTVSLAPALKKLAEWKVVVLADRSGSMTRDVGNSKVARWNWVGDQIVELASDMERSSGSNLNLGLFNHEFSYLPDLKAKEVANTINSTVATGESHLAPLLKSVVDTYFEKPSSKPLLIAIITDGLTANKTAVKSIIKNAAAKAGKTNRLRIVLFQTGFTDEGSRFLDDLQGLTVKDSKPLVSTVLFESSTDSGLLAGLNAAID